MNALPISVFSAAFVAAAAGPAYADLFALPDLSAYMEIVDDEDLESTEVVAALAGFTDPRFSERPTERVEAVEEAVLLG